MEKSTRRSQILIAILTFFTGFAILWLLTFIKPAYYVKMGWQKLSEGNAFWLIEVSPYTDSVIALDTESDQVYYFSDGENQTEDEITFLLPGTSDFAYRDICFVKGSNHIVLVGTNQIALLNLETGEFDQVPYRLDAQGRWFDCVSLSNGDVLVGGEGRILIYKDREWSEVLDSSLGQRFHLAENPEGKIWLGFVDGNIFIWNRENNLFEFQTELFGENLRYIIDNMGFLNSGELVIQTITGDCYIWFIEDDESHLMEIIAFETGGYRKMAIDQNAGEIFIPFQNIIYSAVIFDHQITKLEEVAVFDWNYISAIEIGLNNRRLYAIVGNEGLLFRDLDD